MHKISLYLSWMLPNNYRMPDRLSIIFAIRQFDGDNFNDTMIWLLQNCSDYCFFNSLLTNFKEIHWLQKFFKLCNVLNIPEHISDDSQILFTKTKINV